MYQGEPLQPGSTKAQTEWFTAPLETELAYEEMEAKHRRKELVLYAYGYAKYFDIFGRPHETRFGMFYDSQPSMSMELDQWVAEGPLEYNRSS